MSFWTTFHFIRPGPPPAVSSVQLATFLERFRAEVELTSPRFTTRVIFGRRVDRDTREIDEERVTKIGGAFIAEDVTRPLDIDARSFDESVSALRKVDRRVYRAEILVGDVPPLTYGPAETNTDGLWLAACGLKVGPIAVTSLEGDELTLVSWLALNIGGQGYLWPRKPEDVRADIEAMPAMQQATSICREL
jgi:hypothetical protein